jgi:hypothetical protein
VVNSEYLESRARDGEERHILEEEAARTQAALDDVAILDREEMQERVTRAARALARCRMTLEERAPSIATHEPDGDRRRSSVADQQIIRSVALRVMALDSQEAARRRSESRSSLEDRRASIDSRRGSISDTRRGSISDIRRESISDTRRGSIANTGSGSNPDIRRGSVSDTRRDSIKDIRTGSVIVDFLR